MAEPVPYITPEDYLRRERVADLKSEYVNGQIYGMAGASVAHARIVFNLSVVLGTQLRGRPCEGFGSDMKVRVDETGLYAYPDLSALCGPPAFADDQGDVLLNPSLLVEVLSPSTEAYDRGAKFQHYQRLPSLQEYLLVAQDALRVELYTRQPSGQWLYRQYTEPDETVPLASLGAELLLRDIYARVQFEAEPGE